MTNLMKVFVPGNISLVFKMCLDSDPKISGSLGVGFTVHKGVEVSVQHAQKTETHSVSLGQVFWNGKKIEIPTVESVAQKLLFNRHPKPIQSGIKSGMTIKEISIFIISDLPLGCGFGLSGASALATAYAINDLFNLKKTKLELAKIAHVAEVENGTGLGDVVNQYYTGFLLKTVPSSQFKVQKIPSKNIPIYVKYFSKISTKEILSDTSKKEKIEKAGEMALQKIQDLIKPVFPAKAGIDKNNLYGFSIGACPVLDTGSRMTDRKLFSEIIKISKQFAIDSGLLQDQNVMQTIKEIELRGGYASMIMLGNAVVADIPFEGSTKLLMC